MIKKSFAGLLAGICVITAFAPYAANCVSNAEGDSYEMKVSVKLDGEKKEISPYIYGVNEFGNAENLKNVKVNNVRQGGNRYTGYNWETNWSNAGEDWLHSSDTNIGDDSDGAGYAPQKLSKVCQKYNIPYRITTLQMAGYVSADKDGSVKEDEVAPSNRWKKVAFRKDGELSLTPDTTDDTVYMDEYVNFIVNTLGNAKSETGIQGYSLDNEPVLWNDTHPRLHPEEVTNSELVSKSIELAKVVKEIDPDAEVFGPAFWGMLPCMNIGETGNGFTDPDWQAVKNNYFWYLDYYLDQMAKAEEEAGTRLLDVVDVHYYAQDCSTDDAILQAARSLYDPTYAENSWLQPWGAQYFPFITNIKKSIDKYYPGTKIAISEYNLANISDEKNTGKSVVSAIAEAEALGCFADNDVYFATYWGTLPECPYVASAINLYTNYDGEGASFGDTLVESSTEDLSLATAYAGINGNDDTKVNLVLSNKDKTRTENAVIDLSGTSTEYKSAVVYAITQDESNIHIINVDNNVSGNKLTVELPPLSVANIVLSDKESDAEEYVAPEITTKEITYNFSELEKSKNGYLMIPIEDAKALKKAVINSTAGCNTPNTEWYGGGGGLCFNHLKLADGSESWGQKSFMYGGGTSDCTVTFDGTFTVPIAGTDKSEDVEAEIGDTYIEFQDWWKSSTHDKTGADVTVTYNTITLYYEYEGNATEENVSENPSEEKPENPNVVWGDANEDGDVSISDTVAILQSIANADKYALTEQGAINADVYNNGDGVTGKDAAVIQLVDAGALKKEELPVKSN